MNKAIPYPLVLIFTHGDGLAISVADKRINQADKTKCVVEDGWMTHWFNPSAPNAAERQFMDDLSIESLSFLNFYAFYAGIKNSVIALKASQRSGVYGITSKAQTDTRLESLRPVSYTHLTLPTKA